MGKGTGTKPYEDAIMKPTALCVDFQNELNPFFCCVFYLAKDKLFENYFSKSHRHRVTSRTFNKPLRRDHRHRQ